MNHRGRQSGPRVHGLICGRGHQWAGATVTVCAGQHLALLPAASVRPAQPREGKASASVARSLARPRAQLALALCIAS
jgi:hypothetical protein